MSRSGEKKQQLNHNFDNNSDSVEVLSYAEQVEECFMELYARYDVANAPEKRKNEIIDSFWSDIYKQVFKPDKPLLNNCKSKLLTYDVESIQDVIQIYINLCKRFGGVIKYTQFCNLVGYSRDCIYRWHKYNNTGRYIFTLNDSEYEEDNKYIIYYSVNNNIIEYHGNTANCYRDNDKLSCRRYDVIKKLQEEMQDSNTNQLSNDTMGAAIRANNEEELGKLYEPKRMIQHEQIKQALSVSDLPKLGKLSDNNSILTLPGEIGNE